MHPEESTQVLKNHNHYSSTQTEYNKDLAEYRAVTYGNASWQILEDRVTDDFLDSEYKKKISNELER